MAVVALTPQQQALADVNAAFNTLMSKVLVDLVNVGSPIVMNFFTAIQTNPSVSNILAQQALFMAALPLALPNLEADVAKDAATIGLQLIGQLKALVIGS